MVTYHSSHTATLLPNGEVLVAGGFALPVNGNAMVERYDPAKNSWRAAAPMFTPRVGHTATLLRDGQVLVAGGSPDARNTGLASAERYDPLSDRWLPASAMNTTRVGHTATLLPDGRVLVVGGTTLAGGVGQYLASAELYDPATNRWTATGALATPRSGHQAVLLATGQVLVMAEPINVASSLARNCMTRRVGAGPLLAPWQRRASPTPPPSCATGASS